MRLGENKQIRVRAGIQAVNKNKTTVPAGSRVEYYAAFSQSKGLLDWDPAYNLWRYTRQSYFCPNDQKIKQNFETIGVNVSIAKSSGCGGISIKFTLLQSWISETELRNVCDKLLTRAAYQPATSMLTVLKLGSGIGSVLSVNPDGIKNSPKKEVFNKGIGNTIIEKSLDTVGGFVSNTGYLMPIALLGGAILIFILVKK